MVEKAQLVPQATFAWWTSSCIKSKRILISKNPAIWRDERHNWLHPRKSGTLRCHLSFLVICYGLIPSRDIDYQRIQQFDWMRNKTGHTQLKMVVIPWQWTISPTVSSTLSAGRGELKNFQCWQKGGDLHFWIFIEFFQGGIFWKWLSTVDQYHIR